MCLRCRSLAANTAYADIKVFKLLKVYDSYFVSPFVCITEGIFYKYEKGKNVPMETGIEPELRENEDYVYPYRVEGGWLHAYIDENEAKRALNMLEEGFPDEKFILVEMKIPGGAKYHIGSLGDICSTCLVWEE